MMMVRISSKSNTLMLCVRVATFKSRKWTFWFPAVENKQNRASYLSLDLILSKWIALKPCFCCWRCSKWIFLSLRSILHGHQHVCCFYAKMRRMSNIWCKHRNDLDEMSFQTAQDKEFDVSGFFLRSMTKIYGGCMCLSLWISNKTGLK